MKHLWQWILFELVTFIVSVAGLFGCVVCCQSIFTNMPLNDPILFWIKGVLGILVGILGIGFILAIGILVILSLVINAEVYENEKDFKKRK